ncbi:hypothetical protein RUND412_007617 [Rhizina undulata]
MSSRSTSPSPPATFTGSCHCLAVKYLVSLPAPSSLPLPGTYTHATYARLTVGFHCLLTATVPAPLFITRNKRGSSISSYEISCEGARKTVNFCNRCGTTLFLGNVGRKAVEDGEKNELGDTISILAPTIELGDDDDEEARTSEENGETYTVMGDFGESKAVKRTLRRYIKPENHIFLGDTWKGGISRIMEDGLPRFKAGCTSDIWKPESPENEESEESKNLMVDTTSKLRGGCFCGGVQFSISRPEKNYKNDEILKDWVKPNQRYCAGHCFCHSCRRISGAPFWSWAFIPLQQITFHCDSTMKTYNSFKDSTRSVTRRFCSKCGCHLFFTSTSAEGKMWDVSVSCLDQKKLEEEKWFVWGYDERWEEIGEEGMADAYINGWKEGKRSFEADGEEFCLQLVEEVREGKKRRLGIY